MTYLLIAVLWAAYCALHSFLISITVTTFLSRMMKQYYAFYRLLYVAVSFVLLVPLIRYTSGMEGPETIVTPPLLSILRTVLTWGALGTFAWAFLFDYDPLSFFGIRQIQRFGKSIAGPASAGIKKNGLLGIIRHPMYFTLLVYLWCQTFTVSDVVVNIVLSVYIVIGTYLEERKLVLEFGDAYIQYQKEVPMLVPFSRKILT